MRAGIPDLTGEMETLQFPNGAANLTYLLRFGDTELVLRRPPFGVVAPGAHDMKRSTACSPACGRSSTRRRAHLFCDDHSVIGSDFVVMERRRGVVARDGVPAAMAHHDDVARRMAFALVGAMAELHLLDPAAADLEDLGRPDGLRLARSPAGSRAGARASRRRPAADGRAPRPAGGGVAGADTGVVRAQRPQARQLPVRSH